jgi:hypothetical protein
LYIRIFNETKLKKEIIANINQSGIPKKEYKYNGFETTNGAVTEEIYPK